MSEKPLVAHVRKDDEAENIVALLEKGYTPNISDTLGGTPLMYAAGNGNSVTVSILLRHGANPLAQDGYENTALHYAAGAENRHIPFFSIKFYTTEKGGHNVPKHADFESCIYQLGERMGERINARNGSGRTALMNAVGYPGHVTALLHFAPDLDVEDGHGNTALSIARRYNMEKTISLLLKAGARR
jgi:ankyrin repeat protein